MGGCVVDLCIGFGKSVQKSVLEAMARKTLRVAYVLKWFWLENVFRRVFEMSLSKCLTVVCGDSMVLSQKTAQTSDARFLWKFDFLEIDNLTELTPLAKHSILEVCEDCKTQKKNNTPNTEQTFSRFL